MSVFSQHIRKKPYSNQIIIQTHSTKQIFVTGLFTHGLIFTCMSQSKSEEHENEVSTFERKRVNAKETKPVAFITTQIENPETYTE